MLRKLSGENLRSIDLNKIARTAARIALQDGIEGTARISIYSRSPKKTTIRTGQFSTDNLRGQYNTVSISDQKAGRALRVSLGEGGFDEVRIGEIEYRGDASFALTPKTLVIAAFSGGTQMEDCEYAVKMTKMFEEKLRNTAKRN
ncbi:hypothetical protein A2872_03345 [Candidatus Gottesmanbacteria bacterium RIFCSPHIGHO2_01_FULL_42_12]|uniref:Uncharacterized protein n=1 Tax=Candidatus Gottesmanbacteria bacterium RIFCSPHIGHO2_01_FULL_42_12 TaxID=1798377 RepID=A0A1F5Z464_9BACT|nr:MAG: hypothetical protein A2872_03345 [Candidatus Gottesmanbacteria bacterium RIFCSPHIGHO2_01_FULL_42_12]